MFRKIALAGQDHSGPDLGDVGARQHRNYDVPRPHACYADSSSSKRCSDALVKSSKSSSDQTSDQSIAFPWASSAKRMAKEVNSCRALGGNCLTACTRLSSGRLSSIQVLLESTGINRARPSNALE